MWPTSNNEAQWNLGYYMGLGDMQFQSGTCYDSCIARAPYYSICNVKVNVCCGKTYKHTIYYCLVMPCIKENSPCYNESTFSTPILNFSLWRSDCPFGSPHALWHCIFMIHIHITCCDMIGGWICSWGGGCCATTVTCLAGEPIPW